MDTNKLKKEARQLEPDEAEKPKRTWAQARASVQVYEAIHGINYGEANTRIEPGEVVPAELIQSSPWLLANGHVRPRKGGK